MIHAIFAAILCTLALLFGSADALRSKSSSFSHGFLLFYGLGSGVWVAVAITLDSTPLVVIGLLQLFSLLLLAAVQPGLRSTGEAQSSPSTVAGTESDRSLPALVSMPAGPTERASTFFIDQLVIISAVYGVGGLLWYFVPATQVRHGSMALFTDKELVVYEWTALFASIFIAAYYVLLPHTKLRQTLGGYFMGTELLRPDLLPLDWRTSLRRFLVILLKLAFVFVLGPYLGAAFHNTALSVAGLLAPFFAHGIICWIAQRRDDGTFLWEWLGGYRILKAARLPTSR